MTGSTPGMCGGVRDDNLRWWESLLGVREGAEQTLSTLRNKPPEAAELGGGMLANYGYKNGSGDFFIAIDTDKCDGCGDCVSACLNDVFIVGEDLNDPLRDEPVAMVGEEHRKKLKYTCAPCKPDRNRPPLLCVQACKALAISHSW